MEDNTIDESNEVWKAIDGTVVSWEHRTQIHPETGAVYDFHGVLISPPVVEVTETKAEE